MLSKQISFEECEIKFSKEKEGVFEGYASVYGNVDSDNDRLIKGVFAEAVESQKVVPIFYGHSWRYGGLPVGKSLQLAEDDHGLHMKAGFTMSSDDARKVYALVVDKVMSGLSVGMRVPREGATKGSDGVREIKHAKLIEVSVLPFPANEEAGIEAVKSMVEEIESINDCEHFLRDVGMSHQAAKSFISRFKEIHLRDVGDSADEITALKSQLQRYEARLSRVNRLGSIEKLIHGG